MRTRGLKAAVKAVIPRQFLVSRGRSSNGCVALTFDDGPIRGITDSVLDILVSRGHAATFFAIGERAAAEPELIRRIEASGCEVANHTYSHANVGALSYHQIREEIERTDQILAGNRGAALRFRPPQGHLSVPLLAYLWKRGTRVAPVLWSVCVPREHRKSPDEIVAGLIAADIAAGDIVLLHDDNQRIVSALPAILDHLESRGLRSVPVNQIC